MSCKKGCGIKTFKDTFWSKKRVEANIGVRELADALGLKMSTLASYMVGVSVPPLNVIHDMCDWFNVDYVEGEREFIKAHKEYDAQRRGKSVKAFAKKHKVEAKTVESEPMEKEDNKQEDNKKEEPSMTDAYKKDKILRLAYSQHVPYDFFLTLIDTSVDKLRETLYNKVDYTTYRVIERILDDEVVKVENFDKWSI